MINVCNNLYVGTVDDLKEVYAEVDSVWAVIHASKKAHKELLGYSGWAAPKESPEYLYAERGSELTLNLVNPRDSKYIPVTLIDKALSFIDNNLKKGKKVLVRDNNGKSRAPSIALLYLWYKGFISCVDFVDAEAAFKEHEYYQYEPSLGMRNFMIENWTKYKNKENIMNEDEVKKKEIKEEAVVEAMSMVPPPPPNVPEPPPAEETMKLPSEETELPTAVEEEETDEFENMSKGELRAYVKHNKLPISKYKKLNPDELREAIRNYSEITPIETEKGNEEVIKEPINESPIVEPVREKTNVVKLKNVIKKEFSKSLATKVIAAFDEAIKVQPEGDPTRIMLNSIRVSSNATVMNNMKSKL